MNSRFSQTWLDTACRQIPDVQSAIFVMPDTESHHLRLLAKWPVGLERHGDMLAVANLTLKKREAVRIPFAETTSHTAFDLLALPVPLLRESPGAIVIKRHPQAETSQETAFSSLKRSVTWLRLAGASKNHDDTFYSDVVGLLSTCFEQGSYHEGLLKMVAELTRQFGCERVAYGEYGQHHCQVVALSNSADFDQRSNLIQMIADAMDEAVEQDNVILFPDPKAKLIQRAHQELARQFGSGSLCTLPLVHENKILGALTLMNSEEKPMRSRALNQCRQAVSLITPFLALKRDHEKGLIARSGQALVTQLNVMFGFRFLKLKLAGIFLACILVMASLVETEYRVSSDAVLEGKIQRVIAAPISGYLLSASVRAGDTVHAGDVMASLNDTDLKLEYVKLNGQLQKTRREYRQAQSARDLVKARVVKEQINQANAEIDLNIQQQKSIRLTAPFDGVVIEGDLSQLVGSPVERGDSLFKIAPLDGYRIILKVDESDISRVQKGQTGILALASSPDHRLRLTVEKITAFARADDGANIFRVEASLLDAPDLLRPGMEGVGKIDTGQARLIWIWTHEIKDRLSLWLWSWI